jgi:creatinine amidohydrolase
MISVLLRALPVLAALTLSSALAAQTVTATRSVVPGVPTRDETLATLNAPRPIAALDSVFIEELTWMEIRDAIAAGKKTVIIASGGIEANGAYLATGKHNYVLRATTEAIARELGNALVAPIIPFTPEGDIEPPTAHMVFAGTISVSAETFEALLTDIARSMRAHGFEHIVFVADSGPNVAGMQKVAEALHARWGGRPAVSYIAEYYNYVEVRSWLTTLGINEVADGTHDEYSIASVMMLVDPMTVRMPQRLAVGKFSVNGVSLAPVEQTLANARRIVAYRTKAAVDAIRLKAPR